MKSFIITLGLMILTCVYCYADTITLTNNYNNIPQYAGSYVGPVGGSLNNTVIDGGIICVDVSRISYFGYTYNVNISTITPKNLSLTRQGVAGLVQYEKAAWLLQQIKFNQSQVGEIQFAIWRIFDQAYIDNHYTRTPGEILIEDLWLRAVNNTDLTNYNFADIRIYTPNNNTNQEFMSGELTTVPIPEGILLFGSGIFGLFIIKRGKNK